jgi:hypothetical protein
MKSKITLAFIACMAIATGTSAQVTFSVSPGVKLNGASFGYQIGETVIPSIGIQYMGLKGSFDDGFESVEGKLNLIIPSIGLKFFIAEKNELKAYLSFSVSKPLASGKLEHDGDEEPGVGAAVETLSFIGAKGGFGVEYFFTENFSIGGEFGVRHFKIKYVEVEEIDLSLGITPTYSMWTLNYYF